ncbi:MAG: MupG family TIM beta-alpha barrel fold protein [Atopobiaceae bacterium]|jgi:hypothetical protein|nr:MupG family TIM beta-alpha barrel fold protein [Atopobiaceae bacterium]MCI2172687.1 MupG family TIM beta-alpha barrel fold protein [Atopobiaceae bacterium]MCI2206994.1 MupG family TIM beta-alpha barrel fold protein [Atopobiaceae bacterium]
MKTGISLYLSSGYDANTEVVEKARRAGVSFAFTSLQIPEETGIDHGLECRRLVGLCHEAGIELIADVSPRTLDLLGCSSLSDLTEAGIGYVRLDFGFDAAQTIEASKSLHVVFNASTMGDDDIASWRAAGADLTRFTACHNYYPKPLTGLSLASVARTNARLKAAGFQTMAFVPGDASLRGPLHEGLPTVEAHRGCAGDGVALAMLELAEASTDVVLVGDPDVGEGTWERICDLDRGIVRLRARVDDAYGFVREGTHHDRPDSSDYVIRSQESRGYAQLPKRTFEATPYGDRPRGSISVGNEGFLRYAGELEIARQDLPHEDRVNIIGQVADEDLAFLDHIRSGMGFMLV